MWTRSACCKQSLILITQGRFSHLPISTDSVTLRGPGKVELHCLLSVIVMQAMALGKAKQREFEAIRNNVRMVA